MVTGITVLFELPDGSHRRCEEKRFANIPSYLTLIKSVRSLVPEGDLELCLDEEVLNNKNTSGKLRELMINMHEEPTAVISVRVQDERFARLEQRVKQLEQFEQQMKNLLATDDPVRGRVNVANSYIRGEVDSRAQGEANVADTYSRADIDGQMQGKANVADIYSRGDVDRLMQGKANAGDSYTCAEIDCRMQVKANIAEVDGMILSLAETYSRADIDGQMQVKANIVDIYSRGDVDRQMRTKANAADVYSRGDIDSRIEGKANVADIYSRVEVDGMIGSLFDVYHPVNCIFMCIASQTPPLQGCRGVVWVLLEEGLALMTANSASAGSRCQGHVLSIAQVPLHNQAQRAGEEFPTHEFVKVLCYRRVS